MLDLRGGHVYDYWLAKNYVCLYVYTPIPVAVRSKTWVYGRSLAGIVGSNPAVGMDVCVVFVVRTVAWNVK
jgi:hypothetical protein